MPRNWSGAETQSAFIRLMSLERKSVRPEQSLYPVIRFFRIYEKQSERNRGHDFRASKNLQGAEETEILPEKKKDRPLIYISMGTVINERPDFYKKCIDAFESVNADVIISCGNAVNREEFGTLPSHIRMYPCVDQLDVLAGADAFITHCGMNSVSESLYMAVPMVLYPQTGEQHAVARRVTETGAGIMLKDDSSEGIRASVREVLKHKAYGNAAAECSKDFRACSGAAGAAEFIENAPHSPVK